MLLAEIHGKYDVAVRDHEDYLTSTIFGHLRYLPPGPFWSRLFSKAKTLPINGIESSLTAVLGDQHDLNRYKKLEVHFWPNCAGLGQPELAMCFSGGGQNPVVVLVEIKLWAGKGGDGIDDQLFRYLRIADSICNLKPSVPSNAKVVVVYLTPRESSNEVRESLFLSGDLSANNQRLFRLRWQDVILAIDEEIQHESESSQLILNDVRDFLRVRGLEYFDGFRDFTNIGEIQAIRSFYSREGVFHGFDSAAALMELEIVKGRWVNAD